MIKLSGDARVDFIRCLQAISGSKRIRLSAFALYREIQELKGQDVNMIPWGEMNYQDLYAWCELSGGLLIPENSKRWTATVWKSKPQLITFSFTAPTWKMAVIRAICYALEAKYADVKNVKKTHTTV